MSDALFVQMSWEDGSVNSVKPSMSSMELPDAEIEVLEPFLWPAKREEALSIPPDGPFDQHCTALHWKYREYSGKRYQSTFIPTHRFQDFIQGEEARGGCSFYV